MIVKHLTVLFFCVLLGGCVRPSVRILDIDNNYNVTSALVMLNYQLNTPATHSPNPKIDKAREFNQSGLECLFNCPTLNLHGLTPPRSLIMENKQYVLNN